MPFLGQEFTALLLPLFILNASLSAKVQGSWKCCVVWEDVFSVFKLSSYFKIVLIYNRSKPNECNIR